MATSSTAKTAACASAPSTGAARFIGRNCGGSMNKPMDTYHGVAATPMEIVPAGLIGSVVSPSGIDRRRVEPPVNGYSRPIDDARWLLAGDEPED